MEGVLPLVGGYLFIFCARVTDMSLDVVRILMLTRDRRLWAALIGFVEVVIFLLAISQVLSGGLHDPLKVIAYAGGFATGNYVGSLIDQRLALGYLTMQVFCESSCHGNVCSTLRAEGFGVTSVNGCGRDGERMILFVALKRKDVGKVLSILDKIHPGAVYNIYDSRSIQGGVFPGKKKGL